MLSVLRLHLPSDIPIVGCELSPYVQLRLPDGTTTTDDVPVTSPIDGYYLRWKWCRIQTDKRASVCSVHPSEPATLQCIGCLKAKLPVSKSLHCSSKCFSDSWRHHRAMHAHATNIARENGAEEDELFGRGGSVGGGAPVSNGIIGGPTKTQDQNGTEIWEVGSVKTYTPTEEDVGHALKLECVVMSTATGMPTGGLSNSLLTQRVIPAPCPPPRRMVQVNTIDGLELDGRLGAPGSFTVLSYNVLADLYATSDMYSYCPQWALSWAYRRQNLLREIVGYRADILCLQEIQSDHFDEFFAPELEKHGYSAVYKKKTAEVYAAGVYTIDGCATFYRNDRFLQVKKYEVEFNKAAQSFSEAYMPSAQRKAALTRLLKDNVALIVVLEVLDYPDPSKKQLICVANTHIHANPELKDVKLWQVQTLLKGLEKIAASAEIPMLVAGDFNSVPGSAPHSLLATGRVEPTHPELAIDPLGILRPASKLCHQLPLVSAYSALSRRDGSNEPLFTNCTRDFLGTLDYIFYTADSIVVDSLLELLDEESLRKDTALPSPEWSSDHIALLAEFRCRPSRLRR
ncbi:hypothetical protein SELMODRAFT_270348 [Selaginella moellendorffii]|uniref:poly(A)-specific ribonuclease n=1 Tax=Selaginella moellendorffii TaxID=88036 RepID=D8QXF8_SELML|nr:carbon catabolite repressor protein 4 homolog 1 [Selaginella moellendorffii]XP_002981543.1 carbon catabolite repressor protein 4 homolog 1 [Selaginella moellendorffii]EFJ17358.1 hypothetical protein SELMODRAFT_178984 [Selaginella moellendorffii]EFJ35408.1 hypothetical protein SELMODRAFT_270348 [Selaginella moellendorffii]|eukprot:XP_002963537.1 carbon catabolite repressor protein 4 homolog 1 [Selaginella moellendorffii]